MNAILFVVLILMTVTGDFCIKKATLLPGYSGFHFLILAGILWAGSVPGWFYILRRIELSNSNIIYSLGMIILILGISYFYFHEKISFPEIIGFILALISIYLMARFS